jgi:hypothetical protein
MRRARFFLKVWRRASASILFFHFPLRGNIGLSATDAAVAEPKEMEIELGYFTLERDRGKKHFYRSKAQLRALPGVLRCPTSLSTRAFEEASAERRLSGCLQPD